MNLHEYQQDFFELHRRANLMIEEAEKKLKNFYFPHAWSKNSRLTFDGEDGIRFGTDAVTDPVRLKDLSSSEKIEIAPKLKHFVAEVIERNKEKLAEMKKVYELD